MARGKYSPYCKGSFIPHEWKTGTLGYSVEVDKDGFDSYGYDQDGRDKAGISEHEYLIMSDDEWDDHNFAAGTGTVYISPVKRAEQLEAKIAELKEILEKIDIKAQAGLCQMGHAGTREFLKDIRKIVTESNK